MTKIPCGGFKLDENFFGMNENDELSLVGGGSESQNKNLVLSNLGGNVRWQNYPYHVTVNVTSNFSKATCDTPFEEIVMLMIEKIPIMTTIIVQGMGSFQANILINNETQQIVFMFILKVLEDGRVVSRSLIYNMDDSFSGLEG